MKKLPLLITSLLLVLSIASPVIQGDLYKWIDDKGKVHYGDTPPEQASLRKITGNVSSFSSVSVEPFVFDPKNITRQRTSKTVVMYSTSWCGYCKQAARHFKKNKIPYTDYDIEKSAKAANEYKKLRGRGVPIILIGEQRMNGFDVATFDRIYYGNN
ncbi:MAG: glutaredoxin family protein [Gammaproteobacteria bacterium]|nr:glutaredoxin family protein [Gammaproteobacteria bacterium]MDH3447614.1 glutaredoxin family protein [Gammaproteobacteria bacterium]